MDSVAPFLALLELLLVCGPTSKLTGGDSAQELGYTHFEESDLVRMDSATLAKGKMTAFSPLQVLPSVTALISSVLPRGQPFFK